MDPEPLPEALAVYHLSRTSNRLSSLRWLPGLWKNPRINLIERLENTYPTAGLISRDWLESHQHTADLAVDFRKNPGHAIWRLRGVMAAARGQAWFLVLARVLPRDPVQHNAVGWRPPAVGVVTSAL
jgi:hypothetical protein